MDSFPTLIIKKIMWKTYNSPILTLQKLVETINYISKVILKYFIDIYCYVFSIKYQNQNFGFVV